MAMGTQQGSYHKGPRTNVRSESGSAVTTFSRRMTQCPLLEYNPDNRQWQLTLFETLWFLARAKLKNEDKTGAHALRWRRWQRWQKSAPPVSGVVSPENQRREAGTEPNPGCPQ